MEAKPKMCYVIKIKNPRLKISDLLKNEFRVEINSKYSALQSKDSIYKKIKLVDELNKKLDFPTIKERAEGSYKGLPFEINQYSDEVLVMRINEASVPDFQSIFRFVSRDVIHCKPICSVITVKGIEKANFLNSKSVLLIWDKQNPENTVKDVLAGNCYWLKKDEKIVVINTLNGRKLCTYKTGINHMPLIANERSM